MTSYQHWLIEKDENNILWAGFDRAERTVNTIDESVLDELRQIIADCNKDKTLKALVVCSNKEKGFIAGADITHFSKFTDTSDIAHFLKKGQQVFNELEQLKITTICLIDGFCMGGGYELALACDYRIATDSDSTRIGLPEILLGFHPGWGGTVRLPQLIGGFKALTQVILTGRAHSAKKAKGLGMIDQVVPKRQLKRAAVAYALKAPKKHQPSLLEGLTNQPGIRHLLAKLMKANVAKLVKKAHYPAPFATIDNWVQEGGTSDRALGCEVDSITALITQSETTKNLIRAYMLRERMKSFGKNSNRQFKHVHVVGAGTMGGDIAAWCALKGMTVTLQDRDYASIGPAIKRAHKLYKKKLRKPRLIQEVMDRLIPDVDGRGIKKADMIIEAIFEDLDVKQQLFKSLEEQAKPEAILATNTSSIPLDEINTALNDPSRLVGIHFFNPVAKMELVEVVKGNATNESVLNDSFAFVSQISRLVLPVKSSPGFLVNRVLMPYLMECVSLLDEGYSGDEIDRAAKNFGMMMGPVQLADTVGLDVCLAVAKNLTGHFGGRVPESLVEMVDSGRLGIKSCRGFYTYDKKGKRVKASNGPLSKLTSLLGLNKVAVDKDKETIIANRLILRMVNESAACLREGVVADDDLLDAGMIFGSGFAPFRGGPMQYVKSFGEGKLNALFDSLEREYGERFKADEGL